MRANQGQTPAQLGTTLADIIRGRAPARLERTQVVRYEQYGMCVGCGECPLGRRSRPSARSWRTPMSAAPELTVDAAQPDEPPPESVEHVDLLVLELGEPRRPRSSSEARVG